MSDWLQLAIIAFILVMLGYVVWKGGALNPVGTGTLKRAVEDVDGRLKEIEGTAASKGAVAMLEQQLRTKKEKIDKMDGKFEEVIAIVAELRTDRGARNQVVEALSASVREVTAELKEHQSEVTRRLEDSDKQRERMTELIARVDQGVKGVERNLDRIYNVVVDKGMGR